MLVSSGVFLPHVSGIVSCHSDLIFILFLSEFIYTFFFIQVMVAL